MNEPLIQASNPPARSRGFSMVELLVAVLVMGVGVLGVTGLQLVSLQNNQDALLRGEAIQLAYNMLDRIRVNPGAGVPGNAYDGTGVGDAPPAAGDCIANDCSAADMTTYDIALWKCVLGAYSADNTCIGFRDDGVLPPLTAQPGLPSGDGSIAVDGAGVISVTVQWNGFNNALQTVSIDSQG
jgi:type IV pilus assembly protein PilV